LRSSLRGSLRASWVFRNRAREGTGRESTGKGGERDDGGSRCSPGRIRFARTHPERITPMKFSMIAPLSVAALLFAAAPALSQATQSMSGSAMSNSNATANGNANSMSTTGGGNSMTCQQMMDKANTMTPPTDLTKKSAVTTDMNTAKAAQAAGNESACKSHLQAAMRNMM
jgi:hypothetical protein